MLVPIHRWPDAVKWSGCLLLLFLSGCASQIHQFPPALPPVVSGADPGLDAQARLFESAHRAFAQEHYSLASTLFRRLIDAHHDSPRLNEARWWLARSYEQGGNLAAALVAYRNVIGEAAESALPVGSYAAHARDRLDAIRRSLGPSSLLERRQIALWLTSAEWSSILDVGLWIEQLAAAGVTALILDAGTVSSLSGEEAPIGVYFPTSKIPVIEDRFSVIVPAAHAKGMAVLAVLNLHEPGWMAMNPEWGTAMVGNGDQAFQPVGPVDVLHPDYQRLVGEVTQDLLRTDIDGLVFGARRTKGFLKEWSPTSQRMFEGTYGGSSDNQEQVVSPDPWRWAGWKTRTYLGSVARLAQELRRTRPGLLVAVAVHERAVFFPVDALTDYGEDVTETKQRGLQLVVLPEPSMSERSDERVTMMETVRLRLMPTAGGERHIWLGIPLGALDPSSVAMTVRAILATKVGQAGTHLLLMNGLAIP